jgi:hypothetical protein
VKASALPEETAREKQLKVSGRRYYRFLKENAS